MELRGPAIYIREFDLSDAPAALDLRRRNRDFYIPYFPSQNDYFFTMEGQRREILRSIDEWSKDEAYVFGVFTCDESALCGGVSLRNVARGAWQNATLGYYIDRFHNGRGYATEAARLALRFAFEGLGLHRVQAGTLVDNGASIRVLEKAGFEYEGLSKRYLQINGVWEDHKVFAVTRESWEEQARSVHHESDAAR